MRLYAAGALAIARWEPRIALTRIGIAATETAGAFGVIVEGRGTDDVARITFFVPVGT